MSLKLPRLQLGVALVDPQTGRPTSTFVVWWDRVATALENQEGTQDGLIDELAEQLALIVAVDDKAEAAQATADEALAGGGEMSPTTSLKLSYPDGVTITGSDLGADAAINISAHTRLYGNGDMVAVDVGNVVSLAYSTGYFVSYDDPPRTGGAVTYFEITTNEADARSSPTNPNRHYVGSIVTPGPGDPATTGVPASVS